MPAGFLFDVFALEGLKARYARNRASGQGTAPAVTRRAFAAHRVDRPEPEWNAEAVDAEANGIALVAMGALLGAGVTLTVIFGILLS